jgi:amino acid adenylation domain-containing protein
VERQKLLFEWNNTYKDYASNQCIHQLFELQASLTPEALAVVYKDEQLTYQELNRRSNQLAHYLQKLGVAPEVKVGICVERSLLMVVAILGILKAGGAYVPLDSTYPPERLKFLLEDTQVSILVTQQSLASLFQESSGEHQLVYLERDQEIIAQQSQENPNSGVTAANLAYVIYTSGSTGQPKGVLVEHRGLGNLLNAQIQTFAVKPEDRILQFASLSFDASIFELVMALGVGATLYIVPEDARLGVALISYLRQHAITHATLPPAVLMSLQPTELPALETLISAGEACSPEILARWAIARRFFNAYGLTETTVWSTVAEVTDSSSSIGRAIANTQVYVLDAHLQPQSHRYPR